MRDEEIMEARFDPTCVTSARAATSEEHSKRLDIAIECTNLTTAYEGERILRGLDLAVPSSSSYAITGPAGSGKTTLFKAVVGLVPVSAGKIHIFGRPAENQKKFVAFMPSWRGINWDFPLTLFDFVMLGVYPKLGLLARPVRRFRQDAYSALKKTRLYDLKDKQISGLSTALRQRALAARMLAQETEIYLLDEPFTGVDSESVEILTEVLYTLKDNGKTVLTSLRDFDDVEGHFDKILLLNGGKTAELIVEKTAVTVENIPAAKPVVEKILIERRVTEEKKDLPVSPALIDIQEERKAAAPSNPIEEAASTTHVLPQIPSFEEIAAGLAEEGFLEAEGESGNSLPFVNTPVYDITPEEFDDAIGEYREGVFTPEPHKETPRYNLEAGLSEIAETFELPKELLETETETPEETEVKEETAAETITEEADEELKEKEELDEYAPPQGLNTEINPVFEIFLGVEHEEPASKSPSRKDQDVWSKITEFTRTMGKKKRGK